MKPEEVSTVSQWMAAVEQVAARAQAMDDYPEIFAMERLPDTLHRVIAASQTPIGTIGEFRRAREMGAYHLGQYMRAHQLELPRAALPL